MLPNSWDWLQSKNIIKSVILLFKKTDALWLLIVPKKLYPFYIKFMLYIHTSKENKIACTGFANQPSFHLAAVQLENMKRFRVTIPSITNNSPNFLALSLCSTAKHKARSADELTH